MRISGFLLISLLFLTSAPAQFISISIPQTPESGTIGRSFAFPSPQGQQWLEVLETLLRSQDSAWTNAADTKICLYADEAVVQALHRLYHADDLKEYQSKVTRPLEGLQQESAVREAQRIMLLAEYPPDHPLVTRSAHSIIRKQGSTGMEAVMEKLHQWGSIPSEQEISNWTGQALLTTVVAKVEPEHSEALKRAFSDQSARNSGARYVAAHGLAKIATESDLAWLQETEQMETDSTVQEKLQSIISSLKIKTVGGSDKQNEL